MSGLFKLNGRDIAKGFFLALIASVGNYLVTALQAGTIPPSTDLLHALVIGVGCGCAYLVKNFLTNSTDNLMTQEPTK